MKKGLNKATLVSSCNNFQTAEWFAAYLNANQVLAEARGNAIYAVDLGPERASEFWNFFTRDWYSKLLTCHQYIGTAETQLQEVGYRLAKAQGEFLKTPSACNYTEQERLSLRYQQVYHLVETEKERYRYLASFGDLAEEVKARIAHNERVEASDKALMPMARRIWAEEAAEKGKD